MNKLIPLLVILASAVAAPAPEADVNLLQPVVAYRAPVGFGAPLVYQALSPGGPLSYGAPIGAYPLYPAPIAYNKI